MPFFDAPPPRPEPVPEPESRTPDWLASPSNWLGMPVDLRVVLGRTENVVVAAVDFQAYPTGVRFNLLVRTPRDDPVRGRGAIRSMHFGPDGSEEGGLRFGVRTTQGRSFNYDDVSPGVMYEMLGHLRAATPPAPPLLTSGGGSGGGGEFNRRFWLWPLPPPGPFEMACEWRAMGIDEYVATVDGDRILAAAPHAIQIWPDDEPHR